MWERETINIVDPKKEMGHTVIWAGAMAPQMNIVPKIQT
jgi:hypothetical protein